MQLEMMNVHMSKWALANKIKQLNRSVYAIKPFDAAAGSFEPGAHVCFIGASAIPRTRHPSVSVQRGGDTIAQHAISSPSSDTD